MNTDRKPAELALTNGSDTIVIRPRSAGALDPVLCKSWDLGAPDVRFTQVANPGADGVTYSNGFIGSRTVTLELAVMGGVDPITGIRHDAYWYANKLTQMSHPKAAPRLLITRDDELNAGKTWEMELKGSPYSLPFTSRSASVLDLQLTFTCPLGLIEGPLLSFTTSASGGGNTDLDMPFALPFTFGLSGAVFPKLAMNVAGDSTVTPTVYITGPAKDPEIRSDNGDVFKFKGLTLNAGQTVQIDMGTGAVRLGDSTSTQITDEDMSAYGAVDWAVSSYFVWQPGIHTVSYRSTTGSVTVQYRERRLTI